MNKYANHPTPGQILKMKQRRSSNFKRKYLSILVFLWLLQVGSMAGSIYLFIWKYYDSGMLPALIVSILLFFLSVKSYSYRLDYKKSLGYKIQNAINDNPINALNRKNRRAIQFNKRRRR